MLNKGQKVIDTFKGEIDTFGGEILENEFYGKEAIIIGQDCDNDYYAFYPNCELGWQPTDEEYEIIKSLGINESGTISYIFEDYYEVVE